MDHCQRIHQSTVLLHQEYEHVVFRAHTHRDYTQKGGYYRPDISGYASEALPRPTYKQESGKEKCRAVQPLCAG